MLKLLPTVVVFVFVGSAGGWAGQGVWSPWGALSAVVLGFLAALPYARVESRVTRASVAKSIALAMILSVLLWAAATWLWSLNDMLLNSGGIAGPLEKSALGAGLGFIAGLVVAAHIRVPERRGLRWLRLVSLSVFLGLAFTASALYFTLTGVREPAIYPPPETSPYKLPWPAGETWLCSQGNWGIISHRKHDVYAFDFPMPIGSPVCASRGGMVTQVVDEHDGNGLHKPGNGITIQHDDGSQARYWHIRRGGSRVKKGERVRQGQVIAESGNVGFSTSPHLHFEVYDCDWNPMPTSFSDVHIFRGIPRMGLRYTSGNVESR